jgi:hypothetical protein
MGIEGLEGYTRVGGVEGDIRVQKGISPISYKL